MPFDRGLFGSGLGTFLGGMFGNSGEPYDKAMDQYQQWANKSEGVQNPYLNAGQGAIGDYQQWLQSQKDPSAFINNTMGQYQESPYAHYLQQQSMRAGQNAASASGLSGSTPLMQHLQQQANNISSQDMDKWLQNVLGINTQYGQGQNNLMGYGQNAANQLTNTYNQTGQHMAEAAYGKEAGKKNDLWNTIAGGVGMFGGLFGL